MMVGLQPSDVKDDELTRFMHDFKVEPSETHKTFLSLAIPSMLNLEWLADALRTNEGAIMALLGLRYYKKQDYINSFP